VREVLRVRQNNISKVIYFLYALVGFVILKPYFTWSTYFNGIFDKVGLLLSALILFLFFIFLMKKIKKDISSYLIASSFFVLYTILNLTGLGKGSNLNYLFMTTIYGLVIFTFFLLSESAKKTVYLNFKRLFAISLISSIFFFIVLNTGMNLPYSILEATHQGKASQGFFYINYPGSVFIARDTSSFYRLGGMFDEPGVVGTIGALLLAGDNFKFKGRKDNLIILIGGILSFSLAFYLLVIIGVAIKFLNKGLAKFSFFLFTFIVIFYTVLTLETNNYFINKYIQERIFVEDEIIMSNRANETFDYGFDSFINGDSRYVLFGHGDKMASKNPYISGSYHYKMLIYDYGILGFFLIIAWLIVASIKMNKFNKECLLMLLLFLISIYQRPYVLTFDYILLLFGGYANLKYSNLKNLE
jgi:hypothetical protein